jgi:multimeric flavodoxin WrbA
VCFDRGEDKCPLDDDVLSVRDKIVAADGLVLASPVYVNDVSGTMKTLVDRLAFVCHRPVFMGTPALILATTAGSPTKHTLRTMQSAHISWGGAIIASAGFVTGALSSTEEIRRKYGKRLESLARTVVETITEKHWKSPSFISLVVFTIQQKSWKRYAAQETKESTDAKYWRERGWFDSSSTYYFDHHAPWPRVAFARLVGSALARIFG